jgi:hypothetical protein
MINYTCRYGLGRGANPVTTYDALLSLPYREASDDGKVTLSTAMDDWGGSPLCGDCQAGHLQWAEAAYTAWHRICGICGSHWDLHPIQWGPMRATQQVLDQISSGIICDVHRNHSHTVKSDYVRFRSGKGFVPLDPAEAIGESGKAWGDLLALITPEVWAAAEAPARVQRMAGMAVVSGAWARRARFY